MASPAACARVPRLASLSLATSGDVVSIWRLRRRMVKSYACWSPWKLRNQHLERSQKPVPGQLLSLLVKIGRTNVVGGLLDGLHFG